MRSGSEARVVSQRQRRLLCILTASEGDADGGVSGERGYAEYVVG